MKKRVLVTGMALAMAMAMLTGCGNAKSDYEADVKALTSYTDSEQLDTEDLDKMVDQMQDLVSDLSMKTSEGKDVKKGLQNMVDATEDLVNLLSDDEPDEDKMTELSDKIQDATDEAQDKLKDFKKAAEDAGVSDDLLDELSID